MFRARPCGAGPKPFQVGHTLVGQPLAAGRVRWRFRGDGYLESAPLIVNRTAYVASATGALYGVSMRRGKAAWRARLRLPANRA